MFGVRNSVTLVFFLAVSFIVGSSTANATNTTSFTSPVDPGPYTATCTISFGGNVDWVPILDYAPSSVYLQVARINSKTGVTLAYAFNGSVPPSGISWGWSSGVWAVPVSITMAGWYQGTAWQQDFSGTPLGTKATSILVNVAASAPGGGGG